MAMDSKVQISIGANFSKNVQKDLQKELDILSKSLKLSIKNVDLAGKKLSQSSSKVSDDVVKSNKKQLDSIDKLIQRYKTQQITYEQLDKYSRKAIESDRFKEKSLARQAAAYDKLNKVEKERTKILAEESKINKKLKSTNTVTNIESKTALAEGSLIQKLSKSWKEYEVKAKEQQIQIAKQRLEVQKSLSKQRHTELENSHKEALRLNKIYDTKAREQAKAIQNKLNLNSGGSSRVTMYDPIQIQEKQIKYQSQVDTARNRVSEYSKKGALPVSEAQRLNSLLDGIETKISKISNNKMSQQIGNELGKVRNDLKLAGQEADKTKYALGNMLSEGIKKMAVWSIAATAFYAPIRAFQNGLQTLKEIDTQLVDIAKVTNLTKEQMKALALEASKVGIQYGRTAQEYLSAVTEFSRAGYGQSAENLGEVSMLLQNVGDVNADVANSFLLATDAAYKYKGSQDQLTNVVNGLNNVSNNNATTISKISEGMSVSASTARQAGVDISELSGAIATMTIVSQRSGAEAKNYLPMR